MHRFSSLYYIKMRSQMVKAGGNVKIKNVELIDLLSISILMEEEWQHEEIKLLSDFILCKIANSCKIEHVVGGDREYVRFELLQNIYHLEFEWYGQSIWIESSESTSESIKDLYKIIAKNI